MSARKVSPNDTSRSSSSSLALPTTSSTPQSTSTSAPVPQPPPPTIALNPPSTPSITVNPNDPSHRSSSSTTTSTSTSSISSTPKYPASASRYNPPVPSRMSGTYTSRPNPPRVGTASAPSSPPGTPPNGLQNYYLNAAFQRSQHRLYGSSSGTSTPPRPAISILVPNNQNQNLLPQPTVARRSYSADHLAVNEPEITVTTPGGSNATEEHVMTLQRALSNLIENELRSQKSDEDEDQETEGPIMMKGKGTVSSAGQGSSSGTQKNGISIMPKVVANRMHPEMAERALSHGLVGSDLTLGGLEMSEKERKQLKVDKKKSQNRLSRLFNRDASGSTAVPEHGYILNDLARQPSKAGVLSNLLKLQGNGRHSKQHQYGAPTKEKKDKDKEKKKKRPVMYSRSANNSTTSLATKSVFGTYPPLPATTPRGSTTGLASIGATHRDNANNHRQSFQFDGTFPTSFPAGNSPLQSPNGSPRGSFSYDNTTVGNGSVMGALSAEEKLRITFAVADILQRQDYVLRLARAMIRYGAPSHRLEDAVDHTARTLELNLQCIYLPNVMIVAFTDYETHTSETHLLKVSAGLDMYKFAQVHQVLKLVTHSSMPVEEAIMKLDAINAEKDVNPRWANILAYAVASFCTAPMFFKGNWTDAGVAFVIGGAVGLMNWLSERVPSYSHICEITMSVVVAFVAEALHNQVCRSSVKMAGIVILLPGYTITCSILELSSRHIISGSVRLFYAVIFSLLLGYGLTIGASLWSLFDHSSRRGEVTAVCPESLDLKWNILFVPVFAIALNVWLKAHPRQWVLATLLSIMGYAISWSTSKYGNAGTEVSSALASFAIGFCGNVYQRVTHQLTFQAVVCAVFFLVPGSMGLKGAMAWFTEDMAGGVNFALQMVITAIAISVGLFASALVVYPMGKARSAQMTF